jgi:spore coat-associated protein N
MNTKILFTLLTIGVASAGLGYGTFAFFSDTEESTDNLFTAADLDLTLNGQNGVTASIVGANFAPGDVTSGSIVLRNEGSIFTGDAQNHTVDLDFRAITTVTDDLGNPDDADDGGASAIAFDQYLTITALTYNGTSLLPQIGDVDGDGRFNTLADLEARGEFLDLADPGAAGKTLAIAVQFATDGPNHLKRDVVDLAFTFFLAQSGEVDLA